ncbi:NDR1/HIN1-like protein 13 [Humulus lupulus]|uniref:NDR1/HIN1-like protein 13 n=1 Tax=Humulus lupulus TaxID=3486 RepID=UPI002B406CF9|nr:NDR1/HIN1-like protein 13 [Humulus lupulus]
MRPHNETNPHFARHSQPQLPGQGLDHHDHDPTTPPTTPRGHRKHHGHRGHHRDRTSPQPDHHRHRHHQHGHHRDSRPHHRDSEVVPPVPIPGPSHDNQPHQPFHQYDDRDHRPLRPRAELPSPQYQFQHPHEPSLDHPKPPPPASTSTVPHEVGREPNVWENWRRRPLQESNDMQMPTPRKTSSLAWLLAFLCAIFWVAIILGGLAVLIVYLIFRPRSPRFDVSAATLNAAYLDMGYLLNADLTFLANFTNPNRKVDIHYSYMYIELYYGRSLIATQSMEPFSAPKAQTKLLGLHAVTSQVRLSELEIQRFKRQMMNNGVMFEVKGFFRARSSFGGLLRYSYWLHGRCTIMVTRPPNGVMVAKKCKSKH